MPRSHYKDVAVEPLLAGTQYQEQIAWERHSVEDGVRRYQEMRRACIERGDGSQLRASQRLILHWLDPLIHLVKENQVKDGGTGDILRKLHTPVVAVITVNEVLNMMMREGNGQVKVSRLTHAIGRAILAEIEGRILKRFQKDAWAKLQLRRLRHDRIRKKSKKIVSVWEHEVTTHRIGAILIRALLESASDSDYMEEVFSPAFVRHVQRVRTSKGFRSIATIRMSPKAQRILDDPETHRFFARPRYAPMLVQPMPWSHEHEGGYVHIRTPFVSKPRPIQKKAMAEAEMPAVYEAANALGATAWQINPRIFTVMKQVLDAGGNIAGIPRMNPIPMPPKPIWSELTSEQVREARMERAKTYHANELIKAEARTFLNRWDIVSKLAEKERFYFPHQFDFRGRAYPLPATFHHQQCDSSRGLLEFAQAKEPDSAGTDWLMIHAANCYGVDKCNYQARIDWTKANLDNIERSIRDPLNHRWWMEADGGDSPWQFLAACYALFEPERGARIPVQVDGTCNGMQHYAALGRDPAGAEQCNLVHQDEPADVYQPIATDVARVIAEHAAEGHRAAQQLNGLITRDTVKRPMMTTVYGVTAIGARNQIYEHFKKIGYTDEEIFDTTAYLSDVVMSSIARNNPAAAASMSWLRRVAKACTSGYYSRSPVQWTTPLGWPVVQPYRNEKKRQITTVLQSITLAVPDGALTVNATKQAAGLPPNFIHSIDATHMHMTARKCYQEDMAFAAIHDSYWTHATDMPRLQKHIREQFVKLHTPNLMADFHRQISERCHRVEIPEPPPRGDFDLNQTLRANYLFA